MLLAGCDEQYSCTADIWLLVIHTTIVSNTHTPPWLAKQLCGYIQIVLVCTPAISTYFNATY